MAAPSVSAVPAVVAFSRFAQEVAEREAASTGVRRRRQLRAAAAGAAELADDGVLSRRLLLRCSAPAPVHVILVPPASALNTVAVVPAPGLTRMAGSGGVLLPDTHHIAVYTRADGRRNRRNAVQVPPAEPVA